jgi:hypothetical protein
MQNFTAKQYLMLDIASNYGLDKETWDARLDWFKTVEGIITQADDLNKSPIFRALNKEAAEPALFYAGCIAYRKAIKGLPITYPISLDATASGAQLLAVLIGCEKSGSLCNVVDTGNREDLYTNVYNLMRDILASGDFGFVEGDDAVVDGTGGITRSDAKQAVMTSLYGSTAKPKEVFGEGERLDAFYQVMNEQAPGIWDLNQSLLSLADPEATSYSWTLPDNFHVNVKVMNTIEEPITFLGETYMVPRKVQAPVENDLSLGANTTHSVDGMVVREMERRCYYNFNKITDVTMMLKSGLYEPKSLMDREHDQLVMTLWDNYLQSGFLSARILELLDAENLWWVDRHVVLNMIETLPKKPFPVIAVHDCFRVHPNYGNDLRRQYNQILSEIAQSNLLQFIVNQISKDQLTVEKYGDLTDAVLVANYALS